MISYPHDGCFSLCSRLRFSGWCVFKGSQVCKDFLRKAALQRSWSYQFCDQKSSHRNKHHIYHSNGNMPDAKEQNQLHRSRGIPVKLFFLFIRVFTCFSGFRVSGFHLGYSVEPLIPGRIFYWNENPLIRQMTAQNSIGLRHGR